MGKAVQSLHFPPLRALPKTQKISAWHNLKHRKNCPELTFSHTSTTCTAAESSLVTLLGASEKLPRTYIFQYFHHVQCRRKKPRDSNGIGKAAKSFYFPIMKPSWSAPEASGKPLRSLQFPICFWRRTVYCDKTRSTRKTTRAYILQKFQDTHYLRSNSRCVMGQILSTMTMVTTNDEKTVCFGLLLLWHFFAKH